jgi:HPt (histidine-containing phosphotransfer) domain-containing protein
MKALLVFWSAEENHNNGRGRISRARLVGTVILRAEGDRLMTLASNPAFRSVLNRFHQRMARDRDRLAQLSDAIGVDSPDVLAEITDIAHRLGGSAGTFGLPQVGATAADLEQVLKQGCREAVAVRAQLQNVLAAIDAAQQPA